MACLSFVVRQAIVRQTIRLATCGLLMLIPHAGLMCRARAEGTRKPGGNLIRVWSVGSPYTGALPQTAVPPVVERQAEKLGYTIDVQNFLAADFAAKLRQAVQEHTEPEVLTFDNFGVLLGVTTAAGRIDGVLSDQQIASSLVMVYEALAPLQPRGWVILVRSAANYEAAEALAMQPPVCQPEFSRTTHSPTTAELRQAQETATEAARAYLACDLSSLSAVSDESRLGEKCFLPEDNSRVEAVEPCGVSGNHNLAFVSLVSTFAAQTRVPPTYDRNYARWLTDTALGHQSLLAVLRNQRGVWRLLAITDDPTNTNLATHLTVQGFGGLLEDGPAAPVAPEPASLITPEGANLRSPPPHPFGNFVWRPSPSAEVIGEVAEFLVGDTSSVRERTRLFFLFGREGSLSSGRLWGRAGRWRVWSISRDGNISFSEQRSYLEWLGEPASKR
jgi:hypothetical protein